MNHHGLSLEIHRPAKTGQLTQSKQTTEKRTTDYTDGTDMEWVMHKHIGLPIRAISGSLSSWLQPLGLRQGIRGQSLIVCRSSA